MPRPAKPARLWLEPARADRDAVWYILDKGRKISTGCRATNVAGAERQLERYTGRKYDATRWAGRGLDLPVSEVVDIYLRERAPKAKRADHLIYTAGSILKWWGDKRLADVRLGTCEDYVAWRTGQGVGLTTAWHDLKTLRSAINYWHAAYGPLPAVPVVSMPTVVSGRVRWLRRQEAARALWQARRHERVKRLILIGLYSGTRPGAILDLSWVPSVVGGWVDLDAGVIHRRADDEAETKKRKPAVKIHRKLEHFLRRWREADGGLVVPVCHYHGKRVKKLRRSWATVIVAAGLGRFTEKRNKAGQLYQAFESDVSPHVLRHTAVCWLLQAGVSLWEVAGFVGMSEQTVREVYGHHCPDFQSNAANANRKT